MPCYHPLRGWRNGSGGISFSRSESIGLEMRVPCGQCIGCRLERSRQWAVRCMHEASLYEDNCFVTLTYDDEHLPADGSLDKSHFQKFMKRLRKANPDERIRFFHCGEYGDLGRPHYHACLFNKDFADKVPWKMRNGFPTWLSEELASLWEFGFHELGSLTFESAAYVARYVTKKVTGRNAAEHYERVNPLTGELYQLEPEYTTMSRGGRGKGLGGIGQPWFEKFKAEVYPADEVIVRGKRMKPPRRYDEYLRAELPEMAESIKRSRSLDRDRSEETPERLSVREVCARARLTQLPRRLDDEAASV